MSLYIICGTGYLVENWVNFARIYYFSNLFQKLEKQAKPFGNCYNNRQQFSFNYLQLLCRKSIEFLL